MVALWIWLVLLVWLLITIYLVWKLRSCKCGRVEKFETKKTEEEDSELEKGKVVIAGDKEEKKPKILTEESYAEETEKETKKEEPAKKTEEPVDAKKMIKDKLLNYGEMKIFEGLRDNSYSLTDIKRMIREGEINEKMIEKFLARIEAMENKNYQKKTAEKEDKVEGFTGNSYASAVFQ